MSDSRNSRNSIDISQEPKRNSLQTDPTPLLHAKGELETGLQGSEHKQSPKGCWARVTSLFRGINFIVAR